MNGYCLKCKVQQKIKDGKEETMPNGVHAMRGVCSKCGTKIFKFIKK